MTSSLYTPAEGKARDEIDQKLIDAGWVGQTRPKMNLYEGPGQAVREFAFINAYNSENRHDRVESERSNKFGPTDLLTKTKQASTSSGFETRASRTPTTCRPPAVTAAEIAEDLEAALAEFVEIAAPLTGEPQEVSVSRGKQSHPTSSFDVDVR